jgi:hypothetical protein
MDVRINILGFIYSALLSVSWSDYLQWITTLLIGFGIAVCVIKVRERKVGGKSSSISTIAAILEEHKDNASQSVIIGECFPMERMAAGKKLEEIRELLVRLFSNPSWGEVLDKKAKASAEQILKEFYTDALLDRLQKILDYAKEGVASEIESVHPLTPRNRRLIYLRLIGVKPQVMANIDCKTVNATSVQLSRIRNEIIAKSTPRQARFFSKYDL